MSRARKNRFHITLAGKQSGLNAADVQKCCNFKTEPPKHEKDSWRPLELAADYGLNVCCVKQFEPDKFPEYKGSGYLNTNKEFNTAGDAHTITFKWIGYLTGPAKMRIYTAKFLEMSGQRLRIAPYDEIPAPIFHQFRPFYSFHISIVFGKAHHTDDDDYMENLQFHLFKLMHELAGPFLVKVFELPEKRCVAPPRQEHNRIYCTEYQGIAVPLCKELANNLHKDLCETLKSRFYEMNSSLKVST